MKRLALVAGLLLLAGCGDAEKVVQEEPEAVVYATNEEKATGEKVEEAQEVETRQYTDNELDEFQFAITTASEQAAEYLSNMRADIYICGKVCDGQPLTDIQLSMDVSRSGVEKSAASLESLVPQIRDVANSGSDNVDADEMNWVADQFEKTAADMRAFLAKEDWASWDEPSELIQAMFDELEEVSWLYKPYSPGISEEEGATMEAESNISGAIVEIRYAQGELQTLYDHNARPARNEIYHEDSALGRASVYYLDYTDQYIDLMLSSADLALSYPMDERLEAEFVAVKGKAEQLRQAILDYNGLVGPYQEADNYETLLARWNDINGTLDRIEDGLYLPTYQMDIFLDFAN